MKIVKSKRSTEQAPTVDNVRYAKISDSPSPNKAQNRSAFIVLEYFNLCNRGSLLNINRISII